MIIYIFFSAWFWTKNLRQKLRRITNFHTIFLILTFPNFKLSLFVRFNVKLGFMSFNNIVNSFIILTFLKISRFFKFWQFLRFLSQTFIFHLFLNIKLFLIFILQFAWNLIQKLILILSIFIKIIIFTLIILQIFNFKFLFFI